MSPSDVLAIVRDQYRFSEALDPEAEPGMNLGFDSTVMEWQMACDLVARKQLGPALNEIFNIHGSDDEWYGILHPKASLGGMCEFVSAKGAQRYKIAPFQIAGKACLPAGAFLAVRSALADAGVPVSDCKPSTALDPLLDEHLSAVVCALTKLAPGTLPIPQERFSEPFEGAHKHALILCLVILVSVCLFAPTEIPLVLLAEAVLLSVVLGLCLRYTKRKFGSNYYFENVKTLADLARLILPPPLIV